MQFKRFFFTGGSPQNVNSRFRNDRQPHVKVDVNYPFS